VKSTGVKVCHVLPVQNGLKQGDALSPLLLNFALKGSGRKIPENYEESGSMDSGL
jgi:hypothetical protein